MSSLGPARYAAKRWWAQWLAGCELHRLEEIPSDSGIQIRKTRRRGTRGLIGLGNLYLRFHGVGVEVLADEEWLRWEQAIRLAASAMPAQPEHIPVSPLVQIDGRGLISPHLPGKCLHLLLADRSLPVTDALHMLGLAVQSLRRLHQIQIDWGDGHPQPLSHGDATAENVIVDSAAGEAPWIDFDTRHQPRLNVNDRHADDVRALLVSAALHLPASAFPALVSQVVNSYPVPAVLNSLKDRWLRTIRNPDPYRLAQGPLPLASLEKLVEECRRGLDGSDEPPRVETHGHSG